MHIGWSGDVYDVTLCLVLRLVLVRLLRMTPEIT